MAKVRLQQRRSNLSSTELISSLNGDLNEFKSHFIAPT